MREKNKKMNWKFLSAIALLVIIALAIIGFVIAQSGSGGLEEELGNLSSELIESGYDWLVNYSIDYQVGSVEVYLKDGNAPVGVPPGTRTSEEVPYEGKVIAVIENISSEGFYRSFLDGSSGSGLGRWVNGSGVGVVGLDGNVVNESDVFEKKRIDELRRLIEK